MAITKYLCRRDFYNEALNSAKVFKVGVLPILLFLSILYEKDGSFPL